MIQFARMKHLYLFTLQIGPLEVGKMYDDLPSHLTLMSRFLSEMPHDELASAVKPVFKQASPVALTFGDTNELGPKNVVAHMISSPAEATLHNKLYQRLESLGVEFQYPQFIGRGHKAHVSKREGTTFLKGQTQISSAVYLIEVIDEKRVVRTKIDMYIQ